MSLLLDPLALFLAVAATVIYSGRPIITAVTAYVLTLIIAAATGWEDIPLVDLLVSTAAMLILSALMTTIYRKVYGFPPIMGGVINKPKLYVYGAIGWFVMMLPFTFAEMGHQHVFPDDWLGLFLALIVSIPCLWVSYFLTNKFEHMKLAGNGAKLHQFLTILYLGAWIFALCQELIAPIPQSWLYLVPTVWGSVLIAVFVVLYLSGMVSKPPSYDPLNTNSLPA